MKSFTTKLIKTWFKIIIIFFLFIQTFYNARKSIFMIFEKDCKKMSDFRSVKLKDNSYEKRKYTHKKSSYSSDHKVKGILRTVKKTLESHSINSPLKQYQHARLVWLWSDKFYDKPFLNIVYHLFDHFLKKCHKIKRKL